jgi:peroxiredoxin
MNVSLMKGCRLPEHLLPSTAGELLDLTTIRHGLLVFTPFVLPDGMLPALSVGALEAAKANLTVMHSFALHNRAFKANGIEVFGVTTQSPLVQKVAVESLALPFPLLSDRDRVLCEALHLPMICEGRVTRNRALIVEVRTGLVKAAWNPNNMTGLFEKLH